MDQANITDKANTAWVDAFLAKLDASSGGIITAQVDGVGISATLEPALVAFFQTNKALLLQVGLEAFRQFMLLLSQGKAEQAFDIIAQSMSAQQIIDELNLEAAALSHQNDVRDKFEAALEQFAISLATGAASKILLSFLVV